ncbi:MAG: TetR/AcrR family transcriptional regulator [Sandaracinaceae bacterium]
MAKNERPFSPLAVAADAAAPDDGDEGRGAERSRRSTGKRERILRAATEVFARKGFYATRGSEIAKAAGVADGTIYLYFKNKDDVLIRIFEDRIVQLLDVLRREVAAVEGFDAKVRRIVEIQLAGFEGQRDLAEVITVNLRQSSRLLKEYAKPLFLEYLDFIAQVVADGQSAGTCRADLNPRVVARMLFGCLDGVALTWALRGPDTATPDRLRRDAQHVVDLFLAGLAHPKAADAS